MNSDYAVSTRRCHRVFSHATIRAMNSEPHRAAASPHLTAIALIFCLSFLSCSDKKAAYLVSSPEYRDELRELIHRIDSEESEETRFVINQRIISIYKAAGDRELELLYITSYVENYPNDPFNGYYLLLAAEYYKSVAALPFARYYYERIVKNHADLLLDNGQSIHRVCFSNLIRIVDEPEIVVEYYKELITRFSDEIDNGTTFHELAQIYEALGEWDLAMQFYKEFLKFPETSIAGRPDARKSAIEVVTLYDMPNKRWTQETLEALVTNIQRAIWSKNSRQLNDLRSKVGFFARSWEESESATALSLVSDLGNYLQNRIRIPGDLDHDSNEKEAFLRTTGWGFRIPTWYLYFRKLYFPADPSIHGRWEWAGIYLGEKPY